MWETEQFLQIEVLYTSYGGVIIILYTRQYGKIYLIEQFFREGTSEAD